MSDQYTGYGDVELLSDNRLFVHQCPECQNWQVEYTERVFLTEAQFRAVAGTLQPDLTLCYQMVDDVVEEHYRTEHRFAYRKWKDQQARRRL